MELFDEDFMVNEKTDNKKTTTIIIVLIIFLLVMVLVLVGAMIYIKKTSLTVTIDGKESTVIKNMLVIDKDDPQNVYVPIEQIANSFNYNAFKGDYLTKSEEENQCYVECENEVAMFTLNSNIIYKTLKDGNNDYEYFQINKEKSEAVKSIDGKLYTTIDGIEKAFNVLWEYDVENKKMNIYTMPALVKAYTSKATEKGYKNISEDFNNQKAVLNGRLIVEKGENNEKIAAVLDASTGDPILEAKYEDIQYLEHTKDYLVTSNGKKGIISNSKKTIVKTIYDDIKLMDYDKELYLVEKSKKYGVINFDGKKIIDTEYTQIGIDNTKFTENEIRSKYILADTLIPVKKDKFWAFFDAKGNQVTEVKYDTVGYITSNNKANSGYSLLVVPDYNVIVVGLDNKYTVITTEGKEIWGLVFDSIYMYIDKGEVSYILEYNSETYNLAEQLDGLGYGKNNNKSSSEEEEPQEEQQEEQVENEEESNNNENDQNNEENYSEDVNVDENYNEDQNGDENYNEEDNSQEENYDDEEYYEEEYYEE